MKQSDNSFFVNLISTALRAISKAISHLNKESLILYRTDDQIQWVYFFEDCWISKYAFWGTSVFSLGFQDVRAEVPGWLTFALISLLVICVLIMYYYIIIYYYYTIMLSFHVIVPNPLSLLILSLFLAHRISECWPVEAHVAGDLREEFSQTLHNLHTAETSV